MTTAELIDRIEFWLDKVSAPRFTETRHYLPALNIAQRKFIDDRYGNIKQQKRYAFELNAKVKADLNTLVVKTPFQTTGLVANVITVPNNFNYDLGLQVKIAGKIHTSGDISVNELLETFENSFDAPSDEEPRHTYENRRITVETGGGTVAEYRMFYLRYPLPITAGQTSELPEHTHEELAKLAAASIEGTVEDYNKQQAVEKEAQSQ